MKTKYPIKPVILELVKKRLPHCEFISEDDHHCYRKCNSGSSDQDFTELSVVGLLDLMFEAYTLGQKTKLR